jgi:peptidoglycan/LPS O-acetylase OafA/YrhL
MIKSLTSLRFIFALLVFFVHLDMLHVAIGHCFFIILSGFILSMVYEERILKREIGFKDFIAKRLLRIYPLYVLTFILAIPVSLDWFYDKPIKWAISAVLNLLMLQTLVPNNYVYFSFNGVAWTAADLMIFYAFFPFLIILFSRFKKIHCLAVIGFMILFLLIAMNMTLEQYHHYLFYIFPASRIFGFILGIMLYKLLAGRQLRINYKVASFLEICSVMVLIAFYVFAELNVERLKPYVYSVYLWIPITVLIGIFYFEKGVISQKFLSQKIMCSLGSISFSFFMIHQLVIRYFALLGNNDFTKSCGYYILCFTASLILSYISHNYFETRFYTSKIIRS